LNLDVYFTGAGPSRGSELGCSKYKNTDSTLRNHVIQNGEGLIASEYNKARASTNYSFYVIRYLPKQVATLIALHLIYIRPFARMLFRSIQSSQTAQVKVANIKRKTTQSVSKQAGSQRPKRSGANSVRVNKTNNGNEDVLDTGYIFCSDKSVNKCWTGTELSEILQEESKERLNVKINLWAWRHIIIGIAKAHLQKIAPFFCKDEKGCRAQLETDIYHIIFPWMAGHQGRINTSVYG
jgi:hypothetical protein